MIRCALIVCVACASPGPAARPPVTKNVVAEPKPAGDRCEQVIEKSRAVISEIFERYVSKKPTEADFKQMLETCRAPEEDPAKKEELLACVLAAEGEPAIRTCWTKDLPADVADNPPAQRRPRSEAAINLNKIAKNAKTMFEVNAAFPKGRAAVLPVGQCGCPAKCAVTNAWRTDPVWTELDFEIEEETQYRYTYESDGLTFLATAIGDLDCDGNVATWTLTGAVVNGNPTVTLTAPKGVY